MVYCTLYDDVMCAFPGLDEGGRGVASVEVCASHCGHVSPRCMNVCPYVMSQGIVYVSDDVAALESRRTELLIEVEELESIRREISVFPVMPAAPSVCCVIEIWWIACLQWLAYRIPAANRR